MSLFSRLFGSGNDTSGAPPRIPMPAPSPTTPLDQCDEAHEIWYIPAGTDERIFVGADGTPALHLIDYTDKTGERVLRLVDDRTGLLISPSDRRLPKLGIWVG